MNHSKIIEHYSYLIYRSMKKLNIMGHYDEFLQIGREAVWEASKKFDPHKGEFEPFAYLYIINRMKTAMTKMNRIQARYIVMSDTFLELNGSAINPMKEVSIEEKYFHGLTVKQREVMVERFLNNRSVEETANYLGITVDAVKNRTRDAKKTIIKTLDKDTSS